MAFAAFEDGTVVGTLVLEFPLRENRELVDWTLNVPPEHRRGGYASALFEEGYRFASAEGRTRHVGEVNVPAGIGLEEFAGSRFALRHGFVSEHEEDRLILDLPMPEGALEGLKTHAAEQHDGYTFITWVGACAPEYVDAYVTMRTTMAREVPTGTLDHEPMVWDVERLRASEARLVKGGYRSITTAARDEQGEFAGYSLMFVPASMPGMVYQDDTLVISDHRGHRLGAALKARNLEVVLHDHPDRTQVHTWTAGTNAPMRHVNAAFGFRPVDRMHEMQRDD